MDMPDPPSLPGSTPVPPSLPTSRANPTQQQTQSEPWSPAKELLRQKQAEYSRNVKRYRLLFYVLRITALLAVLVPFTIPLAPAVAIAISALVALAVGLDNLFQPKERWKLFSQATDLLTLAQMKHHGDYKKFKDSLAILQSVESANLEALVNIEDLIEKAKNVATKRERDAA